MNKKYIAIGIVILIGVFALTQLYKKDSGLTVENKQTIKIGAVISLTGPAASFGEYAKNGIGLAVNEINANGGIKGRKVEIVYEDDKTNPKDALSAFNKVVSVDKVQGVVGGLWDFLAQPLFPQALKDKIAFVLPSSFRIEGGFEPNEQSFVMLTDFNKVLKKAEIFLKRGDVKKIAVVHFKSVFGEEIARSFDVMTNSIGKGPMINESYSNFGSADFKTTILKLKQQNVDTVFLDMVDIDTVNFFKRAKELGFKAKFITYVGAYDAFTSENKALLEGITVIDWQFSKPAFASLYEKAYGVAPAKSAQHAYDSVYVLAEAIAESDSSEEVASYIESHSFETINGTIKFLKTHQVDSTDVELRTYKEGSLVPFEK